MNLAQVHLYSDDLEGITGERLGEDVGAWWEWWEAR